MRIAVLSLCVPTFAFTLLLSVASLVAAADAPPAVGDKARDFELADLQGDTVTLAELAKQGPVVLIELRGYPGYQCPACNAQVGQFLGKAKNFAAAHASIVLVYPGPAEGLKQHASEFVRGKSLPENVYLLLDPDYGFTNSYGLRWDAKNETAFPATFVIGKDQKLRFAKVSKTHGDRASADEVLKVLSAK
jgi:peroxiredoxin